MSRTRAADRGQAAPRHPVADHLGFPFPIAVEVRPAHLPPRAKIRTEPFEPIEVDADPDRADDEAYVQQIHDRVQAEIRAERYQLAAKRAFPVVG